MNNTINNTSAQQIAQAMGAREIVPKLQKQKTSSLFSIGSLALGALAGALLTSRESPTIEEPKPTNPNSQALSTGLEKYLVPDEREALKNANYEGPTGVVRAKPVYESPRENYKPIGDGLWADVQIRNGVFGTWIDMNLAQFKNNEFIHEHDIKLWLVTTNPEKLIVKAMGAPETIVEFAPRGGALVYSPSQLMACITKSSSKTIDDKKLIQLQALVGDAIANELHEIQVRAARAITTMTQWGETITQSYSTPLGGSLLQTTTTIGAHYATLCLAAKEHETKLIISIANWLKLSAREQIMQIADWLAKVWVNAPDDFSYPQLQVYSENINQTLLAKFAIGPAATEKAPAANTTPGIAMTPQGGQIESSKELKWPSANNQTWAQTVDELTKAIDTIRDTSIGHSPNTNGWATSISCGTNAKQIVHQ